MKKVNRKFLEEQVKLLIEEQEQKEDKPMEDLSVPGVALGLTFGSPSSFRDLGNWLSSKGLYGWGADAYYKMVLDQLGDIEKENSRAPYSQLMLRFYDTMPVKGDESFNPSTLNLAPDEELARELANVRDFGVRNISRVLKDRRTNDVEQVEEILNIMAHENNLSFEALGGLDESLEDIATSYGFIEAAQAPWGAKLKYTPRTLFKDPTGLKDAGMYKEFAKDIVNSNAEGGDLNDVVEKFIMFHFNGLENRNFMNAMGHMADNSALPKVAKADMAYRKANEMGVKALLGFLDVATATASTVGAIVAFLAAAPTGGASVPVGIGLRMAQKVGMAKVRDALLKGSGARIAKGAAALYQSQKYAKTIKILDGTLAQLSPLVVWAAKWSYDKFLDHVNSIEKHNEEFLKNYAGKTEQERVAFFNENIKPSLEHTAGRHAEAMEAAGFDPDKLTVRVASFEAMQNAYASFDKEYILNLEKNLQEVGKNLEQVNQNVQKVEANKEKIEGAKTQIAAAKKAGGDILNSETPPIPIAKAFQSKSKVSSKKEEPTSKEIKSSDIIFVGDSIAVGMSNQVPNADKVAKVGQTSSWVLSQLQKRFGNAALTEGAEGKTAVISVGTNDAFGAGAGGNYTPEKTLQNIKSIVNILKQNGYKDVKVMPLFQDGIKGRTKLNGYSFDQNKHKEFVDAVNSGLSTAGLSTFDNNVALSKDGIHPKSYKSLLSNAISGSSIVAAQSVAPYDPKQVDAYNKDSEKPKQKFEGGVEKINAFFDRPVSDMNKIPRSQREAAVRKYFEISGASAKAGLPLEALVKQMGAESGYINKDFLGDTKSKYGPSYGIGQILRVTGEALVKKSGQELIDYLNIASNNLDTVVKEHVVNTRYLSRNSWWNEASDTQKQLLILYAYNMGAGNSKRGVKGFMTRAGGDLEKGLSAMNAHYVKKYNYKMGYGHKIMAAAGQSIPKVDFDSVVVKPSSKIEKPTAQAAQSAQAQTSASGQNLQGLIAAMKKAQNYEEFRNAYSDLTGMDYVTSSGKISDLKRYSERARMSNISQFTKERVDFLKALHKENFSNWKREYQTDIKNANGDQEQIDKADRKMAWFHRPVFYVTAFPAGLRKFFDNSGEISFGFEPGTNRNSTSYRANERFYKEDTLNNATYNKFLGQVSVLNDAFIASIEKAEELYKGADSEEQQKLEKMKEYLETFLNISEFTLDGLKNKGTEASRKAFLLSVLDLALRTTI